MKIETGSFAETRADITRKRGRDRATRSCIMMRGRGATRRGFAVLACGMFVAGPDALHAQAAPSAAEFAHYAAARGIAASAAPSIWPGFRVDTVPTQLVLPGRGTLMLGWTGASPAGFARLSSTAYWYAAAEKGAASTAVEVNSRSVAQVLVNDTAMASLAGIIAHESFHAFERGRRSDAVRFGSGENSFYVSQYPVFDSMNESAFALELALLREALQAPTVETARKRAREFAAVRAARQSRMDANVAGFEQMTEVNEGLAEYALVRAASRAPGGQDAAAAIAERAKTLLSTQNISVRLRFYVTGSAQALLLDRLAGDAWKVDLMSRNVTLQQLFTERVGGAGDTASLVAAAMQRHDQDALQADAETRVQHLRASVRARADSLMAGPGITMILDGRETGLGTCGFDPQNMLQLGSGAILHTRWLKACQHGVALEYTTAVLQSGNRLRAVIGEAPDVVLTVSGRVIVVSESAQEVTGLHITSPGVNGTVQRATVVRTPEGVVITPVER